jgi:MGT family glycosyltransferase
MVSKILVLNVPAYGHVNPTLPVVGELVTRGEHIVYYLTEEFEPQVRHSGATFRRVNGIQHRFRIPPGIAPGLQANDSNLQQRMATFFVPMMTDSLRLVPRLIDRVKAEEADYIVYGRICLWGRALAELLGLPAIAFSPTYAMNEHSPLRRQMSSRWSSILNGELSGAAAQAMSEFQETSKDLHERYGLSPIEPTNLFATEEELNIVTLPRQFQPDADAFDERYVFVGPCIAPRSDESTFPLDKLTGRPLLYISLGTVFNTNPRFYAACFDAFANSDWQVVLSIGTSIDPSSLGQTPNNFVISPHLPQLEILQNADMFITHGGMNSTMEAIYYGVPMVVVPQQPEQAMTAARIAELGLGISLEPEQVSASTMRDAVNAVSDDASYRSRVAHMQKAARDAGGYLRAADAVQQFGYQHSAAKKKSKSSPRSRHREG